MFWHLVLLSAGTVLTRKFQMGDSQFILHTSIIVADGQAMQGRQDICNHGIYLVTCISDLEVACEKSTHWPLGDAAVILNLDIFQTHIKDLYLSISCTIAHRWMLQDLTDDWSILVQVMA